MRVGVTGGMGSGKTSLAGLLAARGAQVVDADRLTHQVIERPAVREALKDAFGADLEGADGQLNRRELGHRAFADENTWRRLDQIVRAPLEAELWQQVAHAESVGGQRVVVVDAALLFEWGVQDRFDALVVVVADEATRLRRVAARLQLTKEEARRRLQRQVAPGEQTRQADFVVCNDGSLADLELAADRVWQHLLQARDAGTKRPWRG
jgi:dephospho-CoA kinase